MPARLVPGRSHGRLRRPDQNRHSALGARCRRFRHDQSEDHRRATVAIGAALATVAIDRKPDRLTWKVVGVRLAADEQRSQREDRGAAGVDELRVQFLQRDFGTRQLRPQGGDRFDRQERIGAGRRVKDGEPVTRLEQ